MKRTSNFLFFIIAFRKSQTQENVKKENKFIQLLKKTLFRKDKQNDQDLSVAYKNLVSTEELVLGK